jgi:hypothetical protein
MRRRAVWMALALLAGLPVVAAGKPREAAPDRVWSHPDLERLRPERIAVLPVVSFVYLPKERSYLEDIWLQRMAASRHIWMPAVLCRERMAATSRHGDSLLNAIDNQVRSRGRVDSTACRKLARLLESQGLLCLRIDRWERQTGRVYIDMTASLVDSTGRLLWRVSSEERLESAYSLPKAGKADAEKAGDYRAWRAGGDGALVTGRPGEMGMATQSALQIAADYRAGVVNLFGRWGAMFPQSPRRPATSAAR